jgi:hypothetical protein
MTTSTDVAGYDAPNRIPLVRILAGTIVAIAVAAMLNAIVFFIGDATGAFPDDFRFEAPMGGDETSMGVGNVMLSTISYLVVAGVVFAIISRFSRRPARVFLWVAVVVFLLSLVQPLTLEDAPNDMVAFLIAMHVVTTIVVVAVFTRLAAMSPGTPAAT